MICQKSLNEFLATRSYIDGYVASKCDVAVFDALEQKPSSDLIHLCRWYRHIEALKKSNHQFAPSSKQIDSFQFCKSKCTTKPADDDDDDLFGEEDEETKKLNAQRKAEAQQKKSAKPLPAAKSEVVLNVKVYDSEADMNELNNFVRAIEMEGLVWGGSSLVPVAFGIKMLRITCVVEDEKISVDSLCDKIAENEDLVQSVDIESFNKI